MNRRLGITIVACTVALLAVVAGLLIYDSSDSAAENLVATTSELVRPDSHRLSSVPDGKATFVEFLDFECEACGAMFPSIERLRQDYGDRVTFVVRYFPLPSHPNSERAARAVEAAARQGKFEQMYQLMFATQSTWSHQQSPQDAAFRQLAVDLGLDMARFDADYNDPATLARVRSDVADGDALGVQSTPTFFLNGTVLKPKSYADLTNALDAALR